MSEAVQRFAADLENAVEDALRRNADPEQLEMVLQAASQEMRERAADDGE